ncbi:MAG: F0F1 ATP synthase subunit A [Candidatus Gracilibacteria bacterium]|nr:F0F1 ATP synthase subunit A [Candidatus Gracilibacteria bacterium]
MAGTESGPHIPSMQGELIPNFGFDILGMHFGISNTVLSTWIFMVFLFVALLLFRTNINKKGGFFKTTGLIIVKLIYDFAADFIGDRKFAKKILFLIGGMFIFIFLSNIFSLFLDWILLFAGEDLKLHEYLRPINSDPNTTFALSLIIIFVSHFVAVFKRGIPKYLKGYMFNFHGDGLFEKIINVFVGWLHLIGEVVKALSLSLRLFGNIFAGVVLIAMLAYLGGMISLFGIRIGELFVLPFWFFELFVALIQAIVFFVLASIYFKQAIEEHH